MYVIYDGGIAMQDDVKDDVLPSDTVSNTVWKLAEFTNVINELFEKKYNIELNVTLNTLNNHFRKLEDQGIHYLNRMNNVKICDMLDLKIAEFICAKRSKKLQNVVWQLPQIYDEVGRVFECRKEEDVDMIGNYNENSDIVKLFAELEEKILKAVQENLLENNKQLSIELKGNEKALNESVVHFFELQRQYKKEAIELWEQKPKTDRFTGLFFKTENLKARDEFIEEYIENKMKN